MKKKKKRTLYECAHARVGTGKIYCDQNYPLSQASFDGSLDIQQLAEGRALASRICQQCINFERIGPPVPEEERGWLKIKEDVNNDTNHRQALREAVA
ncbi:hypothetical protein B1772_01005 [Dehalococcoides mccartyi]|nr:hypothetical protein B1772_01005 [Dehalococcoides mccartyi]